MKYLFMLVTLVALVTLPAMISAEPIVIKSGEHKDFSRLVFYHQAMRLPQVSHSEDEILLKFREPVSSIDSTRVFKFIPKKRVAKIELQRGAISIEVPCECSFEIQEYTNQIFYIDIFDSTTKKVESQQKERGVSGNMDTHTSLKPRLSDEIIVGGIPTNVQPTRLDRNFGDGSTPKLELPLLNEYSHLRRISDPFSLAKEISESITPKSTSPVLSENHFSQEYFKQPYILARNSMPSAVSHSSEKCSTELHRDIFDFSDIQTNFTASLGELRSSVVRFDFENDPENALRIAKLYISNTLLPEAKYYLWLHPHDPNIAALWYVLRVLDGNDSTATISVDSFSCITGGVFWSMLSTEKVSLSEKETKEALLYYNALPPKMVEALYPSVKSKFEQLGSPDALEFLSLRGGGVTTPSLEKKPDFQNMARGEFSNNPSYDNANPPDHAEISLNDRVFLEGMARSLQGHEQGRILVRNLLVNHLSSKNWHAALGVIQNEFKSGSVDYATELLSTVFFPKFFADASGVEIFMLTRTELFQSVEPFLTEEHFALLDKKIETFSEQLVPGENLRLSTSTGSPPLTPPSVEGNTPKTLPVESQYSEYENILERSLELRQEIETTLFQE